MGQNLMYKNGNSGQTNVQNGKSTMCKSLFTEQVHLPREVQVLPNENEKLCKIWIISW